MNFFGKLFFDKKKNINGSRKEIKRKVVIRMHYSQAEIDIPSKMTLESEFFLSSPFSLVLLTNFMYNYQFINYETRPK